MKMIRQTAALMLLALALPAAAQSGSDPTPGAPADKPKAEKKVCRTMETTGTLMRGTRTCHTKAEWAAIDQANSDSVAASRDLNGQGGNRQGSGF